MRNVEEIRTKIKKLWAMNTENGCTEAEMMSFHARAQAMMDAYQITDTDIQEAKEEAIKRYDELPGTADPHLIKWHLLYGISKHCGVEFLPVWTGRRQASVIHRHEIGCRVGTMVPRRASRLCVLAAYRTPHYQPAAAFRETYRSTSFCRGGLPAHQRTPGGARQAVRGQADNDGQGVGHCQGRRHSDLHERERHSHPL